MQAIIPRRVFMREIRQNASLIFRLTIREFEARYRGNVLGLVWAILTPILTALTFTFVFTRVFQARWVVDPSTSSSNFTMILLTGVVIHTVFAECVSRAPNLILANAGYVKKVVFPLSVLPIVVVFGALINAVIGLTVVALGSLLLTGSLPPTAPFVLPVLGVFAVFNLALVYVLAALGVYLRDIGQLVGFAVTASMFLTPIFYPLSAVPADFRTVMSLNPLTVAVEQARATLLFGHDPDYASLGFLFSGSVVALALSFWLFQRMRSGFADVI